MLGVLASRRSASQALMASLSGGKPFLIAGVNVIEADETVTMEVARHARDVCKSLGVPMIFKGSWDKANRTSPYGYRGAGLDRGLEILELVKRELNVPVLTDVHETIQVSRVAQVVDVVQIPSFLCRQTDLLVAAAQSGRIVNIKRGQFASAAVMGAAVQKVNELGGSNTVMVSERGQCFGEDLMFDPRQVERLRQECHDSFVVVDATHAAQLPPRQGQTCSSGNRDMVPLIARCAAAAGADGLFLELHPQPNEAPVDSAVQLSLHDLEPLLNQVLAISSCLQTSVPHSVQR